MRATVATHYGRGDSETVDPDTEDAGLCHCTRPVTDNDNDDVDNNDDGEDAGLCHYFPRPGITTGKDNDNDDDDDNDAGLCSLLLPPGGEDNYWKYCENLANSPLQFPARPGSAGARLQKISKLVTWHSHSH